MCGINGAYGIEGAVNIVKSGLAAMRMRGTEAAGLYDGTINYEIAPEDLPYSGSKQAIGHLLHSMVGLLPQPIEGKNSVLAANCEIYNWEELAEKYSVTAQNDAELLLALLDTQPLSNVLDELDGVYAFAYEHNDIVTIARDILGEKPLWYATLCNTNECFTFASERKALVAMGCDEIRELSPRTILHYNIQRGTFTEERRAFFRAEPEHEVDEEKITSHVETLLRAAVKKRIPHTKFGIMLSGGVDSSIITLLAKTYANEKFHCYCVGVPDSPDVIASQEAAKTLGVPLIVIHPTLAMLETELPTILETIEDSNPVKVSVAATFWFACKQAKEDGCKALFSGLGSEEVFAGYERHRRSTDINKECIAGLLKMHERDLYRDDTITMHHGLELRTPMLDTALITYGLRIHPAYKMQTNEEGVLVDKAVLRKAACALGLPRAIAYRPKKAAQYGSGMMKLLEKLSKQGKHETVAHYLESLAGKQNKRLVALLSGGKDSILALHIMHRMRYEISCCVTIESANPDSFMYHTPNTNMTALQAQSMRIPFILTKTTGEKEVELTALEDGLRRAKEEHGVEGVIVGAIQSQYQRERVERVADSLGLTIFSPLWQMDQAAELNLVLQSGIHAIITKVAAEGLDASWLAKEIDEQMIERLTALSLSKGVHPAGEGGEYESLVVDAPLFHEKIVIEETESIKDGLSATLVIRDAKLISKASNNKL